MAQPWAAGSEPVLGRAASSEPVLSQLFLLGWKTQFCKIIRTGWLRKRLLELDG